MSPKFYIAIFMSNEMMTQYKYWCCSGQTALHLAATCRTDYKCLKLLLSWPGVDYTIINKQGETASDVAKRNIKEHSIFEIIKPCYNKI
jgi:hypothetical protein